MRSLMLLQTTLLASACFVGEDKLVGKPCALDRDCPDKFYACVVTRIDGNKSCELVYPPEPAEQTPQATVTYCGDIKPILDRTCVSSCHGQTTTGSGYGNFRLDFFSDPQGALKGAQAMAARIKARTTEGKDMPPAGSTAPTDAERALIGQWVDSGAPQGDPKAGACAK